MIQRRFLRATNWPGFIVSARFAYSGFWAGCWNQNWRKHGDKGELTIGARSIIEDFLAIFCTILLALQKGQAAVS